MTLPGPRIDPRRQAELFAELRERADATVSGRSAVEGDQDFISALLQIAARLSSEVTRRLDRVPEKNVHNFFDWIGVRARAARAARLVAVFRLAQAAPSLLVSARARLQASTDDAPAIFETERDLNVLSGNLQTMVAVDASADQIYLPPPGLLDPTVIKPPDIARKLKSVAAKGSDTVQVSPAIDLNICDVVAIGNQQYRIKDVKGDLVTIDPPLVAETTENAPVIRITSFAPFANQMAAPAQSCGPCASAPSAEPAAATASPAAPHNWQEHALYLGDDDVLNIEATAAIQISDSTLLALDWFYWGKAVKPDTANTAAGPAQDASDWQPLTPDKDPKTGEPVLAKKYRGAIEPIDVHGQQMRVLRNRKAAGDVPGVHNIKIGVASSPLEQDKNATVAFEAVANTTPVPTLFDFFPLGQEPHLFDFFYIGSAEAFSKKGTTVTLGFTVPSATLGPLVVWPRANLPVLLFGVGTDGLLYQIEYDTTHKTIAWIALKRPANTGAGGGTVVTLNNAVIPALAEANGQAVVVVASDQEIWCRDVNRGVWLSLGVIKGNASDAITAVAAGTAGNDINITALKGGKLFQRKLSGPNETWKQVYDGGNQLFATISSVRKPGMIATVANDADGLVALDRSANAKLYYLQNNTAKLVGNASTLVASVQPLALTFGGKIIVVGVSTAPQLIAVHYDPSLGAGAPVEKYGELNGAVVEKSLSLSINTTNQLPSVVFLAQRSSEPHQLGVWLPDGSAGDPVFTTLDSGEREVANGVAVADTSLAPDLPGPLIVPGTHADILLAELSLKPFSVLISNLKQCLLATPVDPTAKILQVEDAAGQHQFHDVSGVIVIEPGTGKGVYLLGTPPAADARKCRPFAFPDPNPVDPNQAVWYDGKRKPPNQKKKLLLDAADVGTFARTLIGIGTEIFEVVSVQPAVAPTEATLGEDLPGTNATVHHYRYLTALSANNDWVNAETRPLLSLSGVASDVVHLLQGSPTLYAPLGFAPRVQRVALDPSQQWAVLGQNWTFTPAMGGTLTFQVVPSTPTSSTWRDFQVQSNPALSWEYWNGSSWWKLAGLTDSTGNLCNDGSVVFTVPTDLQPTGVIGRNNHWIRARLVGGTYGGETYKIHIDGLNTADQTQTIDRSTASINAPRVISLAVTYANNNLVVPKYVVTRDNLAWRDQSDANRSNNAAVELFPTLQNALDELSAKPVQGSTEDGGCVCDDKPADPTVERCGCEQKHATKKDASHDSGDDDGNAEPDVAASSDAQSASSAAAAAPMLFIGTDAPLDNGSVRILWIVEDRVQDVKLVVEALHKGKFVLVTPVDDETHGLSQTGLMSLTFDQAPTPSDLFGETRLWLRLRPQDSMVPWQPVIKGAFLNAVWAEAAETQTSEILKRIPLILKHSLRA